MWSVQCSYGDFAFLHQSLKTQPDMLICSRRLLKPIINVIKICICYMQNILTFPSCLVVTLWLTPNKSEADATTLSFVFCYFFWWCIHFSLLQMWKVPLKLEGKSIVQNAVFIYCSRSCKTSNPGNECDEDFDGRCLRCKTTCAHFPPKEALQHDLCKAFSTLQRFLKVNTADSCSLPLSSSSRQTNLLHYFAYM